MAEHGTTTRYVKGCRCEACRAANTARARAQRHARTERLNRGDAVDIAHGTFSAYTNWGCRCPDCREACRVYAAQRAQEADL